jgi:hypothetical protein
VAPENAADEVEPPNDHDSNNDSDDNDHEAEKRTRSGKISRPHNRENEYPQLYYSNGKVPEMADA